VSEANVTLSGGLPETVLPDPEPALVAALAAAGQDRARLADVVARHPRSSLAWAALGDATDDVVGAYAAYRVGYHRGLDALRASGWRGSGYVRWRHEANQGFLRCLEGLRDRAAQIGEDDEVDRISTFLLQLDPERRPGA
jgi:hypothetical protein